MSMNQVKINKTKKTKKTKTKNPVIKKSKGDKYSTPKYAWEDIKDYIPKDKVIWEPFNDGSEESLKSSQYLKELGFDVVSKPYNDKTGENDFFKSNEGDVVVTNPPFSMCKKVITRFKELNKPFIIICPTSTINNQYYIPMREGTQIIVPRKRINFSNFNDDDIIQGRSFGNGDNRGCKRKSNCCFDCFYLCWKMDLPKDLIFLY